MMHSTASYAAKALAQVTGFNVGGFLVDVFHYFDKSTKGQANGQAKGQAMLKEFCIFCDQEYRKILKYGATRWLSKDVLSMVLLVGSARTSEVWCYSLAQQGSLKYGPPRWLSKEVLSMVLLVGSARKS